MRFLDYSNINGQSVSIRDVKEYAHRPQPVDYGLTHDDLNLYSDLRTCWWCPLDNGKTIQCLRARPDDKYKKGRRWFRVLIPRDWRDRERRGYTAGAAAFWLALFGILTSVNAKTSEDRLLGFSLLGVALACLLYAIIPGILIKQLRRRAGPGLKAYWQALQAYDDNKVAAETLVLGVPRWLRI